MASLRGARSWWKRGPSGPRKDTRKELGLQPWPGASRSFVTRLEQDAVPGRCFRIPFFISRENFVRLYLSCPFGQQTVARNSSSVKACPSSGRGHDPSPGAVQPGEGAGPANASGHKRRPNENNLWIRQAHRRWSFWPQRLCARRDAIRPPSAYRQNRNLSELVLSEAEGPQRRISIRQPCKVELAVTP